MVNARLILENGMVFEGTSFGAATARSGEVVFNTGMVGYPESLTDPSYEGQIIVLTYPLVGNYGVPENKVTNSIAQFESEKIHARGLVVAQYSEHYSHWNAAQSLGEWLKKENIPAITGIDTRKLTKILREKGTMLGKIIFDSDINMDDPNKIDIVRDVTVKERIIYNEKSNTKRVILIDCGVKHNIIRNFLKRDVTLIRVPYDYDFFNETFDAVFISNGPGDPKMCTKTIEHVKMALEKNIPTFGICLGSQIMALAAGGNTYKLKYGHRSQNQPCMLHGTKRCFITSQNHGFAVDMKTMPDGWEEWFVNVNDNTNEGIKHKTKPFLAVQFHPESSPGPNDAEFLFDEFLELLK